jgi:hypothetical protein
MSDGVIFVIPSAVEGSRCEIFKVTQRDGKPGLANDVGCVAASTPLGMTTKDE